MPVQRPALALAAAAAAIAACLAGSPAGAASDFLDDRDFLDDGGSIRSSGERYVRDGRRGYRDLDRPRRFLEDGGSITTVYDSIPIVVRDHRDRPRRHHTHEENRSVITVWDHERGGGYGGAVYPVALPREEGPKLINVEESRLDRQSIGADGIAITYSGGAKIIRLAPGYRRQESGGEVLARAVGAGVSPLSGPPQLEPWSSEWQAWCTEAYDSFDPDRGTYRTFDGQQRFCIAE